MQGTHKLVFFVHHYGRQGIKAKFDKEFLHFSGGYLECKFAKRQNLKDIRGDLLTTGVLRNGKGNIL